MAGVKRIRAKREELFFRRLFSRMRVLECDLKAIEEGIQGGDQNRGGFTKSYPP